MGGEYSAGATRFVALPDVPTVGDATLPGFVADAGYEPQGHEPAEWKKLFLADLQRYAELTRIAKIEPQ